MHWELSEKADRFHKKNETNPFSAEGFPAQKRSSLRSSESFLSIVSTAKAAFVPVFSKGVCSGRAARKIRRGPPVFGRLRLSRAVFRFYPAAGACGADAIKKRSISIFVRARSAYLSSEEKYAMQRISIESIT